MSGYLYHYMSEENVNLIMRSGQINPSQQSIRDAVFGDGVYLTELPPAVGKVKLLQNNWQTNTLGTDKDRSLECCIMIPMRELRETGSLENMVIEDRVIYCYRGGPLHLKDFTFTILNVDTGRKIEASGWSAQSTMPMSLNVDTGRHVDTSGWSVLSMIVMGAVIFAGLSVLGAAVLRTKEGYLYHYTSEENAKLIKQSGKINPSQKSFRDAMFGDGVYLTDLPPSVGKIKLLQNNWQINTLGTDKDRSLECYIRIPTRELLATGSLENMSIEDRGIYCYRGGPLYLEDFSFTIMNVDTGRKMYTSDWSWLSTLALGAVLLAGMFGLGAAVLNCARTNQPQ